GVLAHLIRGTVLYQRLQNVEIGIILLADGNDGLATNLDPGIACLSQRGSTAVSHYGSGNSSEIGTVLDEIFGDLGMTLVRSLHQSRGATLRFLGVGISPTLDQHTYGIDHTRTSCQHQRTTPQRQLFVRISTSIEQRRDHR